MNTPLVANAADVRQVKNARRKESSRIERERAEMRAVLMTIEGRAVFWRLLSALGYGQTLAQHATDRIPVAAGQQDAMWQLLALIVDADEESLIKMMRESSALKKREAAEAEAVRTPEGEPE
jgi:uncharacterized protein YhaN